MYFTFSSLVTNLFFSSIAIIALFIISAKNKFILIFEIRFLIFCMLFGLISLLFPVEFFFTKTINITKIWPTIFFYFNQPLLSIYDNQFSLNYVLSAIWVTGSLICFLRLIIIYIKTSFLIKRFSKITDEIPIEILNKISKRYKRQVKFSLHLSPSLKSPSLFGIKNPRIILPQKEMSKKEWYYILSHEVSHYHNNDLITKLLIEFFIAIYWWNPLLYLLRYRLNVMLEIKVDLDVTNSWEEIQVIEYLDCLISLPKRKNHISPEKYLINFSVKSKPIITQRIKLILDHLYTYKKPNALIKIFLRLIPIFILLLPMLLIIEPYSILPEQENESFIITPENAYYIKNNDGTYDLFLNGEYIVTQIKVIDSQIKIYENEKEALQ